jgi:PIN domain nuclease of toxin-antitoxin system
MKVLVDTQCWLWMNAAPERLSARMRERIERGDTELFLSAASAWEIAIKVALGKLALPDAPSKYVPSRMRVTRTSSLAITEQHAFRAGELPSHHRDPFDRLIIAQAQIERLPILTADPQFESYDVDVMNP